MHKQQNFYLQNLSLLEICNPSISHLLSLAGSENTNYELIKSKDDAFSVLIDNKPLHSKYAPLKEAEAIAQKVYSEKTDLFIITGFGLGYHIESLAKKCSSEQAIIVIEPCIDLLKEALSLRDFSLAFAGRQIIIIPFLSTERLQRAIFAAMDDLLAQNAVEMKNEHFFFYERISRFKEHCLSVKTCFDRAFALLSEGRQEVYDEINFLRQSEFGKRAFSKYTDFRDYLSKNLQISKSNLRPKLALLAAYYLLSFHSYTETFKTGKLDE